MFKELPRRRFLFEELVKRDFKHKYKRTVLGMFWSILAPLLQLSVMALVFSQFFGRTTDHYVIYIFCGNLIFMYYSDATTGAMQSLVSNAGIFTKVNVPHYLFLLSRIVQSLLNFSLTLMVLFIFVLFEPQLHFHIKYVLLLYPVFSLTILNIGVGLLLASMHVFFRDVEYLYQIFTRLLMYLSAIFYNINAYSSSAQTLFYLNPVYVHIKYFRLIILENIIPSFSFHLLCIAYALLALGAGLGVYRKYSRNFLYYL